MKRRNTIIALVVLLAIGFAAVSTTLVLNGVIGLGESDDFKIIFTSASIDGTKRNDVIGSDKTVIKYETKTLTTIEEESVLVYEATNTSRNYDAEVSIECNIVDESGNKVEGNNTYVDMTYEPNSMLLLSGETKSGKVKTRLIKAVTDSMDINIKCTLTGTPKERDTLGDEYVEPNKTGGTLMTRSYNMAFWQHKSNITKVVFENTLTPHETSEDLIYDVSENQDGSVMSYLVPNEDDTTKYTLYINSDGKVVANPNSACLFESFQNLTEIENLEYLDTRNVTIMASLFSGCRSLTSLDLSNFDTSKVEIMAVMFSDCTSLKNIDLSTIDTSKVTNMSGMFSSCSSLSSIRLGNCSNVVSLSGMFSNCSKLENVDTSDCNSFKVNDISRMFNYCQSLKSLDLSNFNTSSVTNMGSMFAGCELLTTVNLSNFDTSNVTDMSSMFGGCKSLKDLNISNFETRNVISMRAIFCECVNLKNLDISNFDISSGANIDFIFEKMPSTATIHVKDKTMQNWILALSSSNRPATWTTDNIIIKEA